MRGLSLILCALLIHGPGRAAGPRDLATFNLGINIHRFTPEDRPLLDGLGKVSTRSDIVWTEVSNKRGRVRPDHRTLKTVLDAPASIRNPIITLIYGHPAHDNGKRPTSPDAIEAFALYGEAVMAKVRSRSNRFEVWNEWNGMRDGPETIAIGKPVEYVRLLADVNRRLKFWHPEIEILGGAIAGTGVPDDWLPRALAAGLLEHCDSLSIHPYFFGAGADERLPEIGLSKRLQEVVTRLRPYENNGRETPLYLTELGWPTMAGPEGVTAEVQARYLARSVMLLALEPRVRGVWIYELRDGPGARDDREQNFGLTLSDGTPKPAYGMMRDLVHLLNLSASVEEIDNGSQGALRTLRFTLRNGSEAWVCWTLRPEAKWTIELDVQPLGRNPVSRLLGSSDTDKAAVQRTASGAVAVSVGEDPVLVTVPARQSRLVGAGAIITP